MTSIPRVRASEARTNYEPRSSRFRIDHPALLIRSDGAESPAIITNISQRGFRLKVASPPAAGERLLLRGELGDIPIEIRWAASSVAGGVFLQPRND
jgi:hypothetical protein